MSAADPKSNGDPKQTQGVKKPSLQLNPPAASIVQAGAQLVGATKYGPYNWRQGSGVEIMTYIGGIKRHIDLLLDGEDSEIDAVTGLPIDHCGAIMAGAAIIIDARECGKLIDNRPPKGGAPALTRKVMK